MTAAYPNLLKPLDLGFTELKNRVLMVTGGFSPYFVGQLSPMASTMKHRGTAMLHRHVTSEVHDAGGKICLQLLHAGRYAYQPFSVSASATKAPITPFKARALSTKGVDKQINDFVDAAKLAKLARYDGVEVMGSEGYFINQFLCERTNKRTDKWGGPFENRMQLPVEIVRRMREAVGPEFIIIYRLSMLDLVEGGQTWDQVVQLGKAIEKAGATIINTCIACNQACLDHVFQLKRASCLVNPRACHETELVLTVAPVSRRIAVVGAGPAGLAAATTAAKRGHQVTLFEADDKIGGQFNYAKRIPGKKEFFETLRYYQRQIEILGIELKLDTRVDSNSLSEAGFDVSEFLTHEFGHHPEGEQVSVADWQAEWGVDPQFEGPGGLAERKRVSSPRKIYLMQRKSSKVGGGLGKTSGWVHRNSLKHRGVEMLRGCSYEKIDDEGLHITLSDKDDKVTESMVLAVDNVIICAGQEPFRALFDDLVNRGIQTHLIGGADVAEELDAKRAIRQGTEVAAGI